MIAHPFLFPHPILRANVASTQAPAPQYRQRNHVERFFNK
jgi:hypothetical protein